MTEHVESTSDNRTAFKAAFDEALTIATEQTELPLMLGTPESGTAG